MFLKDILHERIYSVTAISRFDITQSILTTFLNFK